jgi:hypothetical protein
VGPRYWHSIAVIIAENFDIPQTFVGNLHAGTCCLWTRASFVAI